MHIQWLCPEVRRRRKQTYLCRMSVADCPDHLLLGLPGAMEKSLDTTFWGKRVEEVETLDPEALKKMGLAVDKTGANRQKTEEWEAEQLYKERGIVSEGHNARQIFGKVRGEIPVEKLQVPRRCRETAPPTINVYSDGSLKNCHREAWAIGAAGVWWPSRSFAEEYLADAEVELSYIEEEGGGLKLYTPLAGFGGSSTRTELAAGILAIAANRAAHIGSDNKGFVDGANDIIELCRKGRNPKKPWGTKGDGDLWEVFHSFVKAKGHWAVAVSKVKGHATDDMVAQGRVKPEEKEGNDMADKVADEGIAAHGKAVVCVARRFTLRHKRYTGFVRDVHNHIVEGVAIKNVILEEKEGKKSKFLGGTKS